MKLKEILAISGKSGLFKFVSQGRNGIIVEAFEDGMRSLVPASAKVSALEDIAIFTATEELPLADVFKKIYEHKDGKEAISHKSSNEELKSFFEEILPDYDRERVYVSDIKKVVLWYNILLSHDMLKPEEEEPDEQQDEKKEEKDETVTGEKTEKPAEEKKDSTPEKTPEKSKPNAGKTPKSKD